MSYAMDYYPGAVAQAPADARATFIRKTYGHLAGAVLAFMGLTYFLLQIPGLGELSLNMFAGYSWFIVLLFFMGANYVANMWAHSNTSVAMQYMGLGLCVVAWSVIFLPLLYRAEHTAPGAITSAGILTLTLFLGLTVAVFTTRRDFSSMGTYLKVGGMLALGFCFISIFFPMSNMVGQVFCFLMVALASGYIIYDTSNVMLHYRTDQHVAASLALFSDVALLFWYILQIFMSRRD